MIMRQFARALVHHLARKELSLRDHTMAMRFRDLSATIAVATPVLAGDDICQGGAR